MFVRDLRYALRTLLRARGFAVAVVLTLALGIGANTAIFSVVRGVLLKPLPHKDGDRLVYLRHSIDGSGGENIAFSVPEIIDFRDGAVHLSAGELFIVPKGVEHKPYAESEVQLMLIEPRGVLNTGEEGGERTAQNDVWI